MPRKASTTSKRGSKAAAAAAADLVRPMQDPAPIIAPGPAAVVADRSPSPLPVRAASPEPEAAAEPAHEFTSHTVLVSEKVKARLMRGLPAVIKQYGPDFSDELWLSDLNADKLAKAYAKKRGVKITLSKKEIQANGASGSGFFKTLHKMGISRKQFTSGVKAVGKVAAKAVAPVLPELGAMAGAAAATAAGNPELAPVASLAGRELGKQAQSQINGLGFRPVGAGFRPIKAPLASVQPAHVNHIQGGGFITPMSHHTFQSQHHLIVSRFNR